MDLPSTEDLTWYLGGAGIGALLGYLAKGKVGAIVGAIAGAAGGYAVKTWIWPMFKTVQGAAQAVAPYVQPTLTTKLNILGQPVSYTTPNLDLNPLNWPIGAPPMLGAVPFSIGTQIGTAIVNATGGAVASAETAVVGGVNAVVAEGDALLKSIGL